MGRAFYTELPPTKRLMLVALADHAHDDGGGISAGQIRLARKVGVSDRTARALLMELRRDGYIHRVSMGSKSGRQGVPDRYVLALDRLPTTEQIAAMFPQNTGKYLSGDPPLSPEVSAGDNPRTPEICDKNTGNLTQEHRKPTSAKPSVEPSVEPREEDIGRASARRTRFPPTLFLTDAMAERVRAVGCHDPDAAFEHFRDYHAAKGTVLADWSAGWRTWVANHGHFPCPCKQSRASPRSEAEKTAQNLRDLWAKYDREGKLDDAT